SPGVPLRREPLSPQRIREWYARHCHHATGAAGAGAGGGAAGAGAAGGAGAGAAGGVAGAGGARAAGPGGACTGGTGGTGAAGAGGAAGVGAAGTGAGGAAGVVSRDPGAEVTGAVFAFSRGTARPRPYYVPLLQQPASPLPGPSPYSGPTRGLTERCEPESRPVSPDSCPASLESCFESLVHTVRAGRRVSRPRPPPVPSTHSMTLRPSTAPQHVPLPSPPASSLPDGPDPKSHSLRAASPTVTRFLATAVTDPLFELVAKLVDFATASRLDYATSLVAKSASESVCLPSVGGECALGTDVLEDRQEEFECFAAAVPHLVSMLLAPEGDPDAPDILTPRSYAEAIEGPYSSQWQAAMDAEMASWKSIGTYVDEVPPPGASIVSGMWIFRVKRPLGSPPVFKARYVARGFTQRQGVDFFQIFSPTPKMTTLRVLLHVAAHRDYELHSLDFSTAFLQGSMHEEIWLRRPPGFTGPFPAGTQWSLRRPVYGLRQAPHSSSSDVVEVKLPSRHSTHFNFGVPPKKWADVCPVFANTILYDVNADTTLPELDPDMPTDPERWWDISTMTIKEALARWMGKAVKAAMEEEMHSLFNNVAWELVPRPLGGNVMKNQWIYGADYDETYSLFGSYVTLRIFLSIVAVLDLHVMQLDMKYACLQSKLDQVLYMEQPAYFNDGTSRVCKLLKSLYGLKQSQLLWYSALNRVLIGGRWSKSQVGESLYFKFAADGVGCWLLVYVDDLLAASSSLEMLKDLRELLQNAFELQEITPVQKYLGLEIVRDTSARKLWLHQSAYVDKLRRCFVDKGQKDCCPKTPISVDAYTELTFDDEEYQVREEEEYRQKVGSLQFAVTTTSPAIAYACSKLGSGLTIRSDQHRRELDRCIDYMLNTRDFALEFGGGPDTLRLVGYADSDDSGDWQTRSSTSGYVFMLGGAAVSWASHRIKCMMISSTESEYIAATEVDKEARRLCFLLAEFQLLDAGVPTVIHVDNSSAIAIAEGLGLKGSLKHMERRYIWLQQMVKRKKLALM
ncbi:unnamed protein product, partial [Closterium sp. NIES-54]